MRSAPDAATYARRLGQPSRGLMSRSRDKAKFAIARALAPILSASCGSTRMMIGPGVSIQRLVLSVPEPGIVDADVGASTNAVVSNIIQRTRSTAPANREP